MAEARRRVLERFGVDARARGPLPRPARASRRCREAAAGRRSHRSWEIRRGRPQRPRPWLRAAAPPRRSCGICRRAARFSPGSRSPCSRSARTSVPASRPSSRSARSTFAAGTPRREAQVRAALAASSGRSLLRIDRATIARQARRRARASSRLHLDRAFPNTLRVVVHRERPRAGAAAEQVRLARRRARPCAETAPAPAALASAAPLGARAAFRSRWGTSCRRPRPPRRTRSPLRTAPACPAACARSVVARLVRARARGRVGAAARRAERRAAEARDREADPACDRRRGRRRLPRRQRPRAPGALRQLSSRRLSLRLGWSRFGRFRVDTAGNRPYPAEGRRRSTAPACTRA